MSCRCANYIAIASSSAVGRRAQSPMLDITCRSLLWATEAEMNLATHSVLHDTDRSAPRYVSTFFAEASARVHIMNW